MVKLDKRKIEKILKISLPEKYCVLGVDTASRTGWAKIECDKKNVILDYGFIDIQSKDTYFKFNQMITVFMNLTKDCNTVIIEDVFMKFNVKVHSFLARIGMIVYMSSFLNKTKHMEFVWASSARKTLGLHGNAKKQEVQKEFKEIFDINIDDEDIIDAIVLSLYGLIKHGELFL